MGAKFFREKLISLRERERERERERKQNNIVYRYELTFN